MLKENWWDDYVGIPYVNNGRTKDGADCWGIVRLIHKEVFNNDLPSFTEVSETEQKIETIAQQKENWLEVQSEKAGDVVLFRVAGQAIHVGIVIQPGRFLHAYNGTNVCIESLSNHKWKRRIQGFYRYDTNAATDVRAIAHPLKTQAINLQFVPGMTLHQIAEAIRKEGNVREELGAEAVILVDGYIIPKDKWDIVPNVGSRVEYRAVVAGGGLNPLKLVATVAIMFYAPYMANAMFDAAGWGAATAGTFASTFTGMVTSFAISMVGSMLLNAIFPTRLPSKDTPNYDTETGASTFTVRGGSNKANPYGAIPVVLGKCRFTPPSAMQPYYEADGTVSYLRTVLCWGYGPLHVDASTIKIGDTAVSNFTEIEINTLTGYASDDKTRFNELAAQDVEQLTVGVSLDQVNCRVRSAVRASNVVTVVTRNAHSYTVGTEVILGSAKDNETAVGTITAIVDDYTFRFSNAGSDGTLLADTGTVVANDWYLQGVVWQQRSLGEEVTQVKVTLEYPNGLYKTDATTGAKSENTLEVQVQVKLTSSGIWSQTKTASLTKKMLSPFAQSVIFDVDSGYYDVRVKKLTRITHDSYDSMNVSFTAITGFSNRKPITFPKPLCMSAVRAKGTNQFNGNVEGFNAEVSTICLDWDKNTQTWIERVTNNPASLYRYVLQHPANATALPDSKIDLVTIQQWHEYCTTQGFAYNNVIQQVQSLNEVLKDIAAAGRASQARIDGKHTVLIDKPRDYVSQHFTPHNSWGFEGSKILPKIPHGFRVQFQNEEKDYQQDERVVYDDGYNESNATLLEGLVLPGVTNPATVYKQARFHLAQIKLRPEIYTLNADIEHLVCNRGDLVKVQHDVTMWGLASGRVKQKIDSVNIVLTEDVDLKQGYTYCIRFRNAKGESVVKTLDIINADTTTNTIKLNSAVDADTANPDDLFMFGLVDQETNDLIVLKVEPAANMTAKLSLVDYSPDIYTIDAGLAIPAFNSKISLPMGLLRKAISAVPVISSITSDDSAMYETTAGKFVQGIAVQFRNPASLPEDVTDIELQWDWVGDNTEDWLSSALIPLSKGSYIIPNVKIGDSYTLRARYVDKAGRSGNWCNEQWATVSGRTRPPAAPIEFVAVAEAGSIKLSYQAAYSNDVSNFEVRLSDSNWGISDSNLIYKGNGNSVNYAPNVPGTYTFYVRSISDNGLYSAAKSCSFNYFTISNISDIIATFNDSSNTNASVILDWAIPSKQFDIAGFELSYDSEVKFINANNITIPADWIGDRVFTIKTVDILGNKSSGYSKHVVKLVPNPPTNVRVQVIDNNVMLYWNNAERTTLPVSHVLIKQGTDWNTATEIGPKSGGFTTISELQGGTYKYWLASVDTDGYESSAVSITTEVSQPPDFIFHGSLSSTFTGTLVNAKVETGSNGVLGLVLPINTTETYEQHFNTRGWTSPNSQVQAGYPIFIQPAALTASYTETFDFGSVLASSMITVSINADVVSGTPDLNVQMETSSNNSTWTLHENATSVFASSVRYVRVKIMVTGSDTSLYQISGIVCRADAKQITDSGSVDCLSSDSAGTIFNFSKEFIDVTSITATASGTTAITTVYDYKDTILAATYSIVSGVATFSINNHGLIAGQKVRVMFTTGTTINTAILTVVSASTNSFTANIAEGNTSGSCNIYQQGARIYLFNSSGTRVSGTASWVVRGY